MHIYAYKTDYSCSCIHVCMYVCMYIYIYIPVTPLAGVETNGLNANRQTDKQTNRIGCNSADKQTNRQTDR